LLSRLDDNVGAPVQPRHVEEVFIRTAPVLALVVGGRVIETTAEHPFYVDGRGWVCAHELRVGDRLNSHDGQWLAVQAVEESGRITTVYNVRVEEYHSYFVGCGEWGFSVWAHNADYVINPTGDGTFGLFHKDGNPVIDAGLGVQRRFATKAEAEAWIAPKVSPQKARGATSYMPNAKKWEANNGPGSVRHNDPAPGYTTYRRKDGVEVTYDPKGHPDFSPYATAKVDIGQQAGDYYNDFKAANIKNGQPELGASNPPGMVWHHDPDGKTMWLVPKSIHNTKDGGFSHMGPGGVGSP